MIHNTGGNASKKRRPFLKKVLNIQKLIDDVGGAAKVAEIVGVVRTAPYGWIDRNYISSTNLEKILSADPNLKIDDYFELTTEKQHEQIDGGVGVS